MAVKIRLMRVGKKKQPTYRVVVADGRSPRDGRFIEIIGQYEPRQEPSFVEIDAESALAWLRKGAQPTEQVQKLLTAHGRVGAVRGRAQRSPPSPSCRVAATPPARSTPAVKAEPSRRPTAAAPAPAAEAPAAEAPAAEDAPRPPTAAAPSRSAERADEPAAADESPTSDERPDVSDARRRRRRRRRLRGRGRRRGQPHRRCPRRRRRRARHPQPRRRPRRDRGRRRGAPRRGRAARAREPRRHGSPHRQARPGDPGAAPARACRGRRRRRQGHRRHRRVSAMPPDPGAPPRGRPHRPGARAARRGRRHASRSNRPERAAPGAVLHAGDRELVVDARAPAPGPAGSCASTASTTAPRPSGCTASMLTADPLADDECSTTTSSGCTSSSAPTVRRPRRRTSSARVDAVEANPAHDLLVLDGGVLVPMVFVVEHARRRASWSTRPTACSTSERRHVPCASTCSRSSPSTSTGRSTRRCSAGPAPTGCSTCGCTTCASTPTDRHRTVDDAPFGGGAGHGDDARSRSSPRSRRPSRRGRCSCSRPSGRRFDQAMAARAGRRRRVLAAVRALRGRRPAGRRPPRATASCRSATSCSPAARPRRCVVIEAVTRLVPGRDGQRRRRRPRSRSRDGLLEYPQYTRPAEFRGWAVPEVLRSGDHARIARWRRAARRCAARSSAAPTCSTARGGSRRRGAAAAATSSRPTPPAR